MRVEITVVFDYELSDESNLDEQQNAREEAREEVKDTLEGAGFRIWECTVS